MRSRLGEKATVALLLTLIGLVALVSATYAWLGVSRVPFISDMKVSVMADYGVEIAPDIDGLPGEWARYMDASEYLYNTVPLRPATLWQGSFWMVTYDATGRTNGVKPLSEENFNVLYPEGTDDTLLASQLATERGYMVYLDFWLRTENTAANISLMPAQTDGSGQLRGGTYCVGVPKWDPDALCHINGGYRTETAIRMLFEWQATDINGNVIGDKHYMMYEPNADVHTHEKDGYWETLNVDGDPLMDKSQMIIQRACSWKECEPALEDSVIYTAGSFIQNPQLLRIEKLGLVKVRLYAWMEGQDVDCYARSVAEEVTVHANIAFGAADTEPEDTGIHRRDISDRVK